MRVTLSTWLPCAPDVAWDAVRRPALLEHVAAPLVRFVPIAPARFPERWDEGDHVVALRLFGVIPLGRQHIVTSFAPVERAPAGPRYGVRDDGRGWVARRWDHRIVIEAGPDGGTRYTDVVDVEAGPLTAGVWLFAQLFYRWRQHRWRRLTADGFRALR
jgi:hypothetical protein